MKTSRPWIAALLFGVLHGWSIGNPWNGQALWWLQLIALVWLAGRPSISNGFLFATAWFTSSMWWLYTSMHVYGGLAAPLAALGVITLSAYLALFYALACAGFVWLRRGHAWFDASLFAALWLLAELTRATLMTGLPWSTTGYAHIDSPLVGSASWIGVYGISALASFIAALFALTRSCGLKLLIILVLCIKACGMSTPEATSDKASETTSTEVLTIRLLQGNIAQNEKFDSQTGVATALTWYQERLLGAIKDGVDLVVTPETAVPLMPHQLPLGYWPKLYDAFGQQNKTAALIGIPLGDERDGYTNSVIGLQASSAPYRYDKHHLVPFGEFVPPLFRWFIDLMHIPLGDFKSGDINQPSFSHAGERFAINICFEDLFGEELAKRFANPANAPTVFVNVSNMGWFGDGIAIDEHVNISRMRSVEFARPTIRATNTGETAIINPQGFITQVLPRSTRAVLDAKLVTTMRGHQDLTPYASWTSKYGLQPLWTFALVCVCFALYLKQKRKSK